MVFQGFQKLTLLDYPGHMAVTLFSAGCNFRCPFCHNALLVTEIPDDPGFTEEEILSYLEKRKGLLDAVCFTGGEPTLQPELETFMRKVKEKGYLVKLDTNGSNPAKLKKLVGEGLVDYVAMDVKNAPARYAETAGLPRMDLAPIEESIRYLLTRPVDFEFRTTVTEEFHGVDEIRAIGEWIQGAPRYFLQAFKDSGNLIGEGLHPVSFPTMEKMKASVEGLVDSVAIRGM